MHSTKTGLLTTLALAALMPVAATAATVTVSTTLSVTQRISVDGTGDPNFQDPISGEYVFFDEYRRILDEESGIWDRSLIPAAPPVGGDPYNLESAGTIAIDFSFDDSTLNTANLQNGTAVSSDLTSDTLMGINPGGFAATITHVGGTYVDSAAGPMGYFASDDFATGEPGIGTLDILWVVFDNEVRADGGTTYGFFAAGFSDGYFESLTGGTTFDWEDAQLSYLEFQESIHSFDGNPLFDNQTSGFGAGFTVTSGSGGGGVSPVPLPAALPMLLAGLGGLAMVRRRRKG